MVGERGGGGFGDGESHIDGCFGGCYVFVCGDCEVIRNHQRRGYRCSFVGNVRLFASIVSIKVMSEYI